MNLEKLDLFLHLPHKANEYCDELVSSEYGDWRSPSLDIERSQASAIRIMHDMVPGKGIRLKRLTLHLTRTPCDQRGDPGKLWAKLQVRWNEHASMKDQFEFRGKQKWESREEIEEELELEWPVVLEKVRPRTRYAAVRL